MMKKKKTRERKLKTEERKFKNIHLLMQSFSPDLVQGYREELGFLSFKADTSITLLIDSRAPPRYS